MIDDAIDTILTKAKAVRKAIEEQKYDDAEKLAGQLEFALEVALDYCPGIIRVVDGE